MLKHHPVLKKLWNKAKKIKNGDIIKLDRRYKSTKEFTEALGEYLKIIGRRKTNNWE